MNEFETIPLIFIRDQIRDFFEITHTRKDNFIDKRILQADQNLMGAMKFTQKTATLEVCNLTAELPCDFHYLHLMFAPNGSCADSCGSCNTCCRPMAYINNVDITSKLNGCNTRGYKDCGFTIDKATNQLRFTSLFKEDSVDIYYDGYFTDENGFPLLRKLYEDYYFKYGLWWMYKQMGNRVDAQIAKKEMETSKSATIKNEQVDDFNEDIHNIEATVHSLEKVNYNYYGLYGANYINYGY